MSFLSDTDIRARLGNEILIEPFNEDQLNGCSYDVTLGEFYYECSNYKFDRDMRHNPRVLNPESKESILGYWGGDEPPRRAEKVIDASTAERFHLNIGDEYIVLNPGQLILGHTREFIGTNGNFNSIMNARSTMARCGLTTHKDAGYGDPYFANRWCVELQNFSEVPIVLRVGLRIAQIAFFHIGKVEKNYLVKGHYQRNESFEERQKSWKPSDLLPYAEK